MWSPTYAPDELYHHQRLGAKWGIMNGPPYPLGRSQLSSAERKKSSFISKFAADRKAKKKKKQRQKALEKARATRKANAERARVEAQKAKEAEENKQRLIKSASAEEVMKYQGNFTNDELSTISTRLSYEKSISGYIKPSTVKTGYDKYIEFSEKVGKIATATQSYVDMYNKGAKIYNSLVVRDKVGKKKLPTIG